MVLIEVDKNAIAVNNYLGFGVEWDPLFWHDFNLKAGVTEEDWDLVQKRIRWMKIPIVRMQMLTRWVYQGNNKYDWNSKEMKSLYRHLDVCQKEGIPVILAEWGVETWASAPDIEDTADPKYSEVIGTYLDHLVRKKQYSCIKYFTFVNEPNFEIVPGHRWTRWNRWKKGFKNVFTILNKKKLNELMKLTGPDIGMANNFWHKRAIKQLHSSIDCYDLHFYAWDHVSLWRYIFQRKKSVKKGQFEKFFRKRWNSVLQNDPDGGKKLLIVGEMGINEGAEIPIGNHRIDTYWYGLVMADFAVQLARAGSWVVCAWMLDDTCHGGFFWGLWAGKSGDFKLRPWFYPWSLLSRLFPPGSIIYRVEQPSKSIRILVGQIPEKGSEKWTFCIVNRGDIDINLTLKVPERGSARFNYYIYSEKKAPADDDGFPIPVSTTNYDLNKGIDTKCPANGVIFLSSLPK